MREQVSERAPRSLYFAAVVLLFLFVAVEAGARRGLGPQVYLLRLEGYLREPRPEDRGTDDLTLGWQRKSYRYQLTDLKVMSGGRLAGDILSAVRLYRPNFFLFGPEAMLHRLDEARPGALVQIIGYYRGGPRTLMINEVNLLPEPTVPAATTPVG